MQVLGIVPKKNRRKKPGDGGESEVNSSSSIAESKLGTDVLATPGSTNMSSLPPQIFPFRLKKVRSQPQAKNYTNTPAIEELRQSRKKWRKDRADLFTIYGKNFRNFLPTFSCDCRSNVMSCFCTELFSRGASIIWSTK